MKKFKKTIKWLWEEVLYPIEKNQKGTIYVGSIVITIVIMLSVTGLFWFPFFFTIVSTTENGVRSDWGKIQDEVTGEGLYFYNPIKTDITKVDMRERKTTIKTNTVSREGLKFGIDITIRYRVKEGQAVYLKKNLQTELSELIGSYTNSTIDDVATGKDKNEMYSDTGRIEIVKAVKDKLNEELKDYADISQVIFEDITLPESITSAIQSQQAELEKIKQKENQKQVAEKEADIKRIEAQGIADANKIIQKSLTREYLQYEAIQKLNPEAVKVFIPTNGMTPTIDFTK